MPGSNVGEISAPWVKMVQGSNVDNTISNESEIDDGLKRRIAKQIELLRVESDNQPQNNTTSNESEIDDDLKRRVAKQIELLRMESEKNEERKNAVNEARRAQPPKEAQTKSPSEEDKLTKQKAKLLENSFSCCTHEALSCKTTKLYRHKKTQKKNNTPLPLA